MTVGEATRQYQTVLEARRRLLAAVGEQVAFDAERQDAERDVSEAGEAMREIWTRHESDRLLALAAA